MEGGAGREQPLVAKEGVLTAAYLKDASVKIIDKCIAAAGFGRDPFKQRTRSSYFIEKPELGYQDFKEPD